MTIITEEYPASPEAPVTVSLSITDHVGHVKDDVSWSLELEDNSSVTISRAAGKVRIVQGPA